MKKDLIILGIVFIPLIIYRVVSGIKSIISYQRHKKVLKEMGRWRK